jgi:uncharacterized protein YbcI
LSCDEPDPLEGDALLHAITDAMVAHHLRYHGRAPTTARTTLMGTDLISCVLGGIYTEVEKTLIEIDGPRGVHATRQRFQETIRPKVIGTVEQLSGRRVVSCISNYNVGPDIAVELFLLAGVDEGQFDPLPD